MSVCASVCARKREREGGSKRGRKKERERERGMEGERERERKQACGLMCLLGLPALAGSGPCQWAVPTWGEIMPPDSRAKAVRGGCVSSTTSLTVISRST